MPITPQLFALPLRRAGSVPSWVLDAPPGLLPVSGRPLPDVKPPHILPASSPYPTQPPTLLTLPYRILPDPTPKLPP